jgi:hypothetical protein
MFSHQRWVGKMLDNRVMHGFPFKASWLFYSTQAEPYASKEGRNNDDDFYTFTIQRSLSVPTKTKELSNLRLKILG